MSKFCANCGSTMEEEDKVCGQCGTPVKKAAFNPSGAKDAVSKAVGNKKLLMPIGIGVGALALLILIVVFATVSGGYNNAVKKYVKCLYKNDVKGLVSMASSIDETEVQKNIMFNMTTVDKVYEKIIADELDGLEDRVGKIKKIDYEIADEIELSDRKVKEIQETLEKRYNTELKHIKKIVKVDLIVTARGDKKSYSDNINELYFIREKGGWKISLGLKDLI